MHTAIVVDQTVNIKNGLPDGVRGCGNHFERVVTCDYGQGCCTVGTCPNVLCGDGGSSKKSLALLK